MFRLLHTHFEHRHLTHNMDVAPQKIKLTVISKYKRVDKRTETSSYQTQSRFSVSRIVTLDTHIDILALTEDLNKCLVAID